MKIERHEITERGDPIGYTVRCSCGWSARFKKQNALARAAKVRAAIREHFHRVETAQLAPVQ